MLRTAFILLAATVLTLGATGLEAQQRNRDSGQQAASAQGFTSQERELIVRFFTHNRVEAQALPPGIARNLARGKPLPPGIARRALPEALSASLPSRSGMEITLFGDRIVLLEAGGLVVDIIEGILRQ